MMSYNGASAPTILSFIWAVAVAVVASTNLGLMVGVIDHITSDVLLSLLKMPIDMIIKQIIFQNLSAIKPQMALPFITVSLFLVVSFLFAYVIAGGREGGDLSRRPTRDNQPEKKPEESPTYIAVLLILIFSVTYIQITLFPGSGGAVPIY